MISNIEQYLGKAPVTPRLVTFGFPGYVATSAMTELSVTVDYIISPIEADPQSLALSFAYARMIQELGVDFVESQIQDLFLLWNGVNRSASTMITKPFSQHAQEQSLKILDARIYHSIRFSHGLTQGGVKSVFHHSYLPPVTTLRPQIGVDEWIEEVIQKLGLRKDASV